MFHMSSVHLVFTSEICHVHIKCICLNLPVHLVLDFHSIPVPLELLLNLCPVNEVVMCCSVPCCCVLCCSSVLLWFVLSFYVLFV